MGNRRSCAEADTVLRSAGLLLARFPTPDSRFPRAGAQRRLVVEVGDLPIDHMHVAMSARGQFRVVRDHHDGGALAIDLLHQLHHAARHQRIEIAGRFVGEQQARGTGQRTRDRHALLLAAGELRRIVLDARCETDAAERLLDAPLALGRREAR